MTTTTQNPRQSETADKLADMLRENTGRSILDSGDHYGRHWERNQDQDFASQAGGTLEFCARDGVDILATVNVYHFLLDRLEYNEDLDNRYRKYVEREDLYLDLQSAQGFVNSLAGAKGIYGDGQPFAENTYNGNDLLSQVIQYVYWTDDDGAHILLQIHNGCDVRGGYTDPVAFDVTDETAIFDNARATIHCDDCRKTWDTDDGYHWYSDGCCGRGYRELNEYPATDKRPDYPDRPEPCGVLWIDDDGNGHCPYCSGLLKLAP